MSADTPAWMAKHIEEVWKALDLDMGADHLGEAVREIKRLRAVGVVLDAVTAALEDPNRPEESPVDAVRRLLAEVEQLTTARDTTQREVCERRARDHAPRFGDNEAAATLARKIAADLGWTCFDEPVVASKASSRSKFARDLGASTLSAIERGEPRPVRKGSQIPVGTFTAEDFARIMAASHSAVGYSEADGLIVIAGGAL